MPKKSNANIERFIETFERLGRAEQGKRLFLGLKNSEVRILLCIGRLSSENKDIINVSEISKRMYLTSPTVTELIKGLNRMGYVERLADPKDKRVYEIKLTDKGEKIVQKVTNYFNTLYSGLIEKLGEEQSKTFLDLLDQVCQYLDETSIEID